MLALTPSQVRVRFLFWLTRLPIHVFVAADLLSQAEHDELASAILITTSEKLAEEVSKEVDAFCEVLSRKAIIENLWRTTVTF